MLNLLQIEGLGAGRRDALQNMHQRLVGATVLLDSEDQLGVVKDLIREAEDLMRPPTDVPSLEDLLQLFRRRLKELDDPDDEPN